MDCTTYQDLPIFKKELRSDTIDVNACVLLSSTKIVVLFF